MIVAGLAVIGLGGAGALDSIPDLAITFLESFVWAGLVWGVLNWVPILPLDGGHMLQHGLEMFTPAKAVGIARVVSVVVGVAAVVAAFYYGRTFLAIFVGMITLMGLRSARDEEPRPAPAPEPSPTDVVPTKIPQRSRSEDLPTVSSSFSPPQKGGRPRRCEGGRSGLGARIVELGLPPGARALRWREGDGPRGRARVRSPSAGDEVRASRSARALRGREGSLGACIAEMRPDRDSGWLSWPLRRSPLLAHYNGVYLYFRIRFPAGVRAYPEAFT